MQSAGLGSPSTTCDLLSRFVHANPRESLIAIRKPNMVRHWRLHWPRILQRRANCAGHCFSARPRATLVDSGADGDLVLVGFAVESAQHGAGDDGAFAAPRLVLEQGVTGYVCSARSWSLRTPGCGIPRDFRTAIVEVVRAADSDTDTTAAIVGNHRCTSVRKGFHPSGSASLWEWPRTTMDGAIGRTTARASSIGGQTEQTMRLPVYGVVSKEPGVSGIVLVHGMRRLLPPY